jgi:hypothetical protein
MHSTKGDKAGDRDVPASKAGQNRLMDGKGPYQTVHII